MNTKELRDLINTSEDASWFGQINISLNTIDGKKEIQSFVNIYQYLSSEMDFLDSKKLPDEFEQVLDKYRRALGYMDQCINNIKSWSRPNFSSNWRKVEQLFGQVTIFPISEMPSTEFLLGIFQKNPRNFKGAYDFLSRSLNNNSFQNADYFKGTIMGYEFSSREDTELLSRKNHEKVSIGKIRSRFQKSIEEAELTIQHLEKTNQEFISTHKKTCDSETEKRASLFDQWFQESKNGYAEFNTKSKSDLEELEKLYREKLKLEAPAKYWSDRATTLRKSGERWLIFLIVSILLAVAILSAILFFIADGTLKDLFDNTGSAIRWSIVLITLISFLAYGLRIFSKLIFSSFHLVRDAEEREQLVYVYLALVKDKKIDETERHLIMQSIFSRADSGLLREESSPTMPGNIVDRILKKE